MSSNRQTCPVCGGVGLLYNTIANEANDYHYDYYRCKSCHCIFIDHAIIGSIDNGEPLLRYDEKYWEAELSSAIERSYGVALARMAEAFYYSRIPIHRFLDIGAGAGYFLDAVAIHLPDHKDLFYGIEKFPPVPEKRTSAKNYLTCGYDDLNMKFDGGICIEVIEHLTPKMLRQLLTDIAGASNRGALYIINSGMDKYVVKEDPDYLDPFVRGHIMSWSFKGIEKMCEGSGFRALPINGKTWALALEFDSGSGKYEDITRRVWSPRDENIKALTDSKTGSVLKLLGFETARAYQSNNLFYNILQILKGTFRGW